jgi:anti-sigma regulatory factor (Ser/Thr protein kinase)
VHEALFVTHDERAPAQARAFAKAWLRSLRGSRVPGEELLTVVSELVTNAVRYGNPPIEVSLHKLDDGTVRVEVSDTSIETPTVVDAPDRQEDLALRIVDAYASRWGAATTTYGNTIWFEVDGLLRSA